MNFWICRFWIFVFTTVVFNWTSRFTNKEPKFSSSDLVSTVSGAAAAFTATICLLSSSLEVINRSPLFKLSPVLPKHLTVVTDGGDEEEEEEDTAEVGRSRCINLVAVIVLVFALWTKFFALYLYQVKKKEDSKHILAGICPDVKIYTPTSLLLGEVCFEFSRLMTWRNGIQTFVGPAVFRAAHVALIFFLTTSWNVLSFETPELSIGGRRRWLAGVSNAHVPEWTVNDSSTCWNSEFWWTVGPWTEPNKKLLP